MCIKIVLNNDIKQNAYSRDPFSKRNDETIQEMTALYSDLPLLFQSSRQQHTVVGCARAARRQPERAAAERTMRILSSTNTKRDENRSKKRNDLQSQQAHIPFALHRPAAARRDGRHAPGGTSAHRALARNTSAHTTVLVN